MNIARERLTRTFLVDSPWTSSRDVVRALGAVQAQDFPGAKWALSQRTGITDAVIERDFADGNILRTHVLRPTWHFVDPRDIRWMLRLTGPRIKSALASYDRKLELDDRVYRHSNAAIEKALSGGQFLTRAELKAVLARARVGPLGVQRAAHLVTRAELDALVCSGPRRGKQFTYALLDERAPAVAQRDRDQDLLDLTLRYFTSRSPATAHDFGWWSGLAMADVRRGIDLARDELESITIDGSPYWMHGASQARRQASTHLLPNYDEFFIGFRDRSAIGQRLRSTRTVTGGNAFIAHVIAIDGQLVGGWKRFAGRRGPELRFTLATSLTDKEFRSVWREVRRFEEFLGASVVVHGLPPVAGTRRRVRSRR